MRAYLRSWVKRWYRDWRCENYYHFWNKGFAASPTVMVYKCKNCGASYIAPRKRPF